MNLPQQLYSAEQVRALDRCAIEDYNTPGIDLMERAGAATYFAMRQRWPRAQRIAIFCGGGNNGGDGFVVARLAKDAGLNVTVYLLAEQSRLKGDAKRAFDKMIQASVPLVTGADQYDDQADIMVDALLGTGLSGEVEGPWKASIDWINQLSKNSACHVVSADIPSGLHADTGRVMGTAVRADLTVTFIGLKMGLFTAMGPDCCGELVFDNLQVDAEVYDHVSCSATLLNRELFKSIFPRRSSASHKGSHGHVLIIGGNYGMAGAVRMAGEAALRCGAGMVSVACRPEHVAAVVSQRPELMCHALDEDVKQLTPCLKELISSVDCIVVGPGLGQDSWAQQIFSLVRESHIPTVIDADALNLLARDHDSAAHDNWVLTPHPGEAGRLLGLTTGEIQNDRFSAIRTLQARYGGSIILKGAGSLVMDSENKISVCAAGNPGMGTAGMGDVLSGVLAACITQSKNIALSAQVATLLHASAADQAAAQSGERGLIASDLFPYLQLLVNPA